MNVYFDETNHIRKIGISRNQKSTIEISTEFFFSYAFFEISESMISDLTFAEQEYKSLFNVGEFELKSSHFFKSNNKIYDLKKSQVDFFRKIFAILSKNKFAQVAYISILDAYFDQLFIQTDSKAFRYSIEKFIIYHYLDEFLKFVDENDDVDLVYKWIKEKLSSSLLTSNANEVKGIKEMLRIFDFFKKDSQNLDGDINRLNYSLIFKSYMALLEEKDIWVDKLFIDREANVEKEFSEASNNSKYFQAISGDSKKMIGIRAVDWYLGFFRRFLLDMSPPINENSTITKPCEKMVAFINSNKKLIRNFYQTIGTDYWSTFFSPFSDRFIYSMSAAKLIASGQDFNEPYSLGEVFRHMNKK